jgi:hypothetical protein
MSPKSGKAGSAVTPASPESAKEADTAKAGEVDKTKGAAKEIKKAKGNSNTVKPFKPPKNNSEEDQKKKTSWVEIELVGEDDKPLPGERYRITLPDDSVAEGTLDEKGFARVAGFEPGGCKVTFPDLDEEAWEKV